MLGAVEGQVGATDQLVGPVPASSITMPTLAETLIS